MPSSIYCLWIIIDVFVEITALSWPAFDVFLEVINAQCWEKTFWSLRHFKARWIFILLKSRKRFAFHSPFVYQFPFTEHDKLTSNDEIINKFSSTLVHYIPIDNQEINDRFTKYWKAITWAFGYHVRVYTFFLFKWLFISSSERSGGTAGSPRREGIQNDLSRKKLRFVPKISTALLN